MDSIIRLGLLLAAATALLVVGAAPAWAHGAGGQDASNYRSQVTRVVARDGSPSASADGVSWRVLAIDGPLEVRNDSDEELMVLGYEGEPYLRVGSDGVFENRNAPATYTNDDRYAEVALPAGASAASPPDWVRIGSEPVAAWHDHRSHWMARVPPPQVRADPGRGRRILEWSVPFTHGGRELAVEGTLDWVPGPSWWPTALAAVALVVLPVGAVAWLRPDRVVAVAALAASAVGVLGVALAVDDVRSMPSTAGEAALALARPMTAALLAGLAAWRATRSEAAQAAGLLALAAGALLLGVGVPRAPAITASQLAGSLPHMLVRVVAGAALALPIAAGVAALTVLRRPVEAPVHPDPPREPVAG